MSLMKIQVGQLWKKDATGDIYLVTRLYSEALSTMAVLRKSGAEGEAQVLINGREVVLVVHALGNGVAPAGRLDVPERVERRAGPKELDQVPMEVAAFGALALLERIEREDVVGVVGVAGRIGRRGIGRRGGEQLDGGRLAEAFESIRRTTARGALQERIPERGE